MQQLTPIECRALKAAAHHLNPVVSIASNGLTANVVNEIDRALSSHELIKVRVYGADREQRVEFLTQICEQLGCAPVQQIGNLLVLYRQKPEEEAPKPAAKPRAARPAKATARGTDRPRSGTYTTRSTGRANGQNRREGGFASRRGGKPRP